MDGEQFRVRVVQRWCRLVENWYNTCGFRRAAGIHFGVRFLECTNIFALTRWGKLGRQVNAAARKAYRATLAKAVKDE